MLCLTHNGENAGGVTWTIVMKVFGKITDITGIMIVLRPRHLREELTSIKQLV